MAASLSSFACSSGPADQRTDAAARDAAPDKLDAIVDAVADAVADAPRDTTSQDPLDARPDGSSASDVARGRSNDVRASLPRHLRHG